MFIYKNYTATWDDIKMEGYDPAEVHKLPKLQKGLHAKVQHLAKPLLCLNKLGKRGDNHELKAKLEKYKLAPERLNWAQKLKTIAACIVKNPAMKISRADRDVYLGHYLDGHKKFIKSVSIYKADNEKMNTQFGGHWLKSKSKFFEKPGNFQHNLHQAAKSFRLDQIFKTADDVLFYKDDGESDEVATGGDEEESDHEESW